MPRTTTSKSPLRWALAAVAIAAIAAAVVILAWPGQSATDKARQDGQHLGAAVTELQTATSLDDVSAARTDLRSALNDTRGDVSDAVNNQIDDQVDALNRAADGYTGSRTSEDAWDVDIYQSELNTALDDLSNNADQLRTQGPEVQQAFWEGYQDGLSGD